MSDQYSDLTICTTTLYKGDEIGNLRKSFAKKFFQHTEDLGISTVVVDGGSESSFVDELKQHNTVQVYKEPELGMGESRRFAFMRALENADTEFVLWSEPEKYDLIQAATIDTMLRGLRDDEYDIVVPHREDTETMPTFQAESEFEANRRATNIMEGNAPEDTVPKGKEFDLFFGPKMFSRDTSSYFLGYPTTEGEMDYWDAIIKPVVLAYKEGKRVGSIPVDFSYDPREKDLEEVKKREIMEWKRALQHAGILADLGDQYWKERVRFTKR